MRRANERKGSYSESHLWQVRAVLLLLGWMAPLLLAGEGSASLPESLTTDQKILQLEAEIARRPETVALQNRLAWAYIQKGRETGEAAYFTRAERLLEKPGAESAPDPERLGLRAWIALFKHEFNTAALWAEKAIAAQPNGFFQYGILSDAFLEMGDDAKAVAYAQKMIDLKPDQGSYSRAAHLRSLHGDSEGAITLWKAAIRAGASYPENTAWCRSELGELYFNIGKLDEAEAAYRASLETFPGYHRALAGLGKIRTAQRRWEEGVTFYREAIDRIPYPVYFASLGDLYMEMGKEAEARKAYLRVEQIARLNQASQLLYDRDLALFYADHDRHLDDAVRIAERELERRRDLYTYDILGWVYYKSGRYLEAARAMKEAMRLGTQDPRILFHAGMIARAAGKEKEGRRLLARALALNPEFHPLYARSAREALRTASF